MLILFKFGGVCMKTKILFVMLIVILALAACKPAATEAPTEAAPVATAVPTEVQPTAVSATEVPPTEAPTVAPTSSEPFVFGIVMVGPYNDKGWNTAHYVAGQYVEQKMNARMIYIDNVNSASMPGTTPAQVAEQLVEQGARFVIFDSDDMKDSAVEFAKNHPDIPVIHSSGDTSWQDGKVFEDIPNLVNVMGRMEYGKMIAGCSAALTTQTGQIGYLGPLINDETRRLVASAYLGAKYCWTNVLGKDIADLKFKVTWIGFWFNIPGFTSDPTQVADDFFNSGYDVLLSGIDTTEALTEAKKFKDQGSTVWAIPYDYEDACAEAPDVCLGVPYFNWGPFYLRYIQDYIGGTFTQNFEWLGPDWADINNPDTSYVGYVLGDALSPDVAVQVEDFEGLLAGGLNLWTGPINLQDTTPYLAGGEVATDFQIWYLPQLLEGIEGQSVSQ
jgi:simple sugar transport system substrate-binding protein